MWMQLLIHALISLLVCLLSVCKMGPMISVKLKSCRNLLRFEVENRKWKREAYSRQFTIQITEVLI